MKKSCKSSKLRNDLSHDTVCIVSRQVWPVVSHWFSEEEDRSLISDWKSSESWSSDFYSPVFLQHHEQTPLDRLCWPLMSQALHRGSPYVAQALKPAGAGDAALLGHDFVLKAAASRRESFSFFSHTGQGAALFKPQSHSPLNQHTQSLVWLSGTITKPFVFSSSATWHHCLFSNLCRGLMTWKQEVN